MSDFHFPALDLNLLRVFDALFEERSVTRTGDRLGLTQSAVSHALGRLRLAIGDDLFVRRSTGMEPTPRALEIGPGLHAALMQLQGALAPTAFNPAVTERQFVVSAGSYACAVLIPALVEALRRRAPGASLRVATNGPDILEALDAGRIDAAVTGVETRPRRFRFNLLLTETMVWIVRPGHPLAKGELTLERLIDTAHVVISSYEDRQDQGGMTALSASIGEGGGWGQTGFTQELLARRLGRKVGVVVPDSFSALAIVVRSDMAAMIPRRLAEVVSGAGRVTVLEPPYATSPSEVGALFREDRLADPAVAWLAQMLAQTAADL